MAMRGHYPCRESNPDRRSRSQQYLLSCVWALSRRNVILTQITSSSWLELVNVLWRNEWGSLLFLFTQKRISSSQLNRLWKNAVTVHAMNPSESLFTAPWNNALLCTILIQSKAYCLLCLTSFASVSAEKRRSRNLFGAENWRKVMVQPCVPNCRRQWWSSVLVRKEQIKEEFWLLCSVNRR